MWGRLSSLRPAFEPALAPLTHCPPFHPTALLWWSKPPGLPCRRSRRQSDTIPNATGVPTPSSPHDCALHLKPPPLFHLRVLRVLRGLFSPCPPCSLWFAFSVPSMSCPMWGRLSSLRPAFQPAWAPLTQCLSCNRSLLRPLQHAALLATPALLVEQAARLAMPAVTPAERHNPQRYGSSHAIQPARLRAPPQAAPSFPSPCSPWFVFSVSSVFSVVCFFRALHVVSDVGQAF
jgi:hypothetical protein